MIKKTLSHCWCNGKKLITFTTGNVKGSDFCRKFWENAWFAKMHLTGCIGEIISFDEILDDQKNSHIHEYLMKMWGIYLYNCFVLMPKGLQRRVKHPVL